MKVPVFLGSGNMSYNRKHILQVTDILGTEDKTMTSGPSCHPSLLCLVSMVGLQHWVYALVLGAGAPIWLER